MAMINDIIESAKQEKAKEMAAQLIDEAKESLKPFGAKANTLKDLADFIIERDY